MKTKLLPCLMAVCLIFSFWFPVSAEELYPDIILVGYTSLLIPDTDKTEYPFTVCYVMSLVLKIASGKLSKSETMGFREISIFKGGVVL